MTSSSSFNCTACGTTNPPQAASCMACGQLFPASAGDTAFAPLLSAQQPAPPAPPALLAGRYHVIGMVGKGGFGAVYQAEDVQRNNAPVAIKEITLSGLSSQEIIEATETFNREVRLLSGLGHPNLPRLYEHFSDAEHWYLAMDFIEGQTLEEYLDSIQGKQVPVGEVLDIGIQLCTVLHYLHTRQPPIIFRDVKPANVMRTATRHLYLIDFGIARHFTPGQGRDTSALGSPGYAAPEQYGKAQTSVQSDIYSLGATLQTLLTGRDPLEPIFGYASPYAVEVPAELKLLLMQMLDLDADGRPASMDVVKHALQHIQDEQRLLHPGSLPPQVLPARYPAQHPASAVQQTPLVSGPGGQVLQPPAKRGISRRAAIIGLVSLVGLATIGGSLTLSEISQRSQSFLVSPTPDAHLVSPTPDAHLVYIYRGHSDQVNAVAWSPDSKRIASASDDTTVQVWDAADGSHVYTYLGHSSVVQAAAWSPDGKRIASASWDSTVQVWDAADGSHAYTYRGYSSQSFPYAVAWSPDGKRIASGNDDDTTVQVWNAADGSHVFIYQGHSFGVLAVAWSPDGKRIASGSYVGTVEVWDAADGSHVYTYRGHSSVVQAVAWSPDGKHIASGGIDKTVQVWDAADGSHVYTYQGHSSAVEAVAWSPDGKRIASASDDTTVQVWDAADGSHVSTYRGHSDQVYAVAWSPDGKHIASGGNDKTVQVWRAP